MSPVRTLILFAVLTVGCAPKSPDDGANVAGDGGSNNDGFSLDNDSSAEDESGLTGDVAPVDAPDMAPAAAVYAHSANTLYKLDPDSKAVKVIGNFNGCSGVVDIALDARSNLYASASGIFLVDKNTAKCTRVGGGTFAGNSLSFVPAGTIDPAKEALVTYSGGQYMRVDIDKGTTTNLGSLPFGFASSGDIVSVKGGGTYVTVVGNGCGDCLLEVDPKTGSMIKNWGSLGTGRVYGVAYWAGVVYAFNEAGQIWEVNFVSGKLVTKEIPIPMRPSGLQFWGAGSTTAAPVVPVK